MPAPFFTIGHSTRSVAELLEMLRAAEIRLLVDVRSFPRSRTNPAFNIDTLPDDLERAQIGYKHWPAFGGRRGKQRGVDTALNALWRVQSFHNYADYALGDDFGRAFSELVQIGRDRRLALMCSEAVWWRCHRRIIADYLLADGQSVNHLMAPGRTDQAFMTPGAVKLENRKVIYPGPLSQDDAPPALQDRGA